MVDLYALPPEEFIAARDAAAKVDKALKPLRRPSVSAWVLNTLVRRDASPLDRLADLGAELLAAQAAGDGPALRALGARRRALVQEVSDDAVRLVGRDLSAGVRDEVAATLDAVVADKASATAVRSGRLVRSLSFAGFGGVDLDGAVAHLPARSTSRSTPRPTSLSTPRTTARSTARSTARTTARSTSETPSRVSRSGGEDVPGVATPEEPVVAMLERAANAAAGALDDAVRVAGAAARALVLAQQATATAEQARATAVAAVSDAQDVLQRAQDVHRVAEHRRVVAEQAKAGAALAAERAQEQVADAQDAAEQARQALSARRR